MSQEIKILLLSSIIIPTWISITKFRAIDKNYLPFIYFLWLSLIIDLVDSILGVPSAIITTNIYYLFESLFVLWQFKRWGQFNHNKSANLLFACFILFWLLEFCAIVSVIYSEGDYIYHSYFPCFYSLLFTFFSINQITSRSTSMSTQMTTHPLFIICSAFILYYCYTCIMSVFYMPVLGIKLLAFYRNVYLIMYFILFICNILYAYAIYQMSKNNPANQKHTTCNSNAMGRPSII